MKTDKNIRRAPGYDNPFRPPSHPGARRGEAGVALLELLVGLTIFTLVMLLLTAGQASLVSSWGRAQSDARRQDQIIRCQDIMSRQLRSAVSFKPASANTRAASFNGLGNQLTFVSSLPARLGAPPGLWLVTYRLESSPGQAGQNLVAEQRSALDPNYWQGNPSSARKVILLTGIQKFQLSYYTWDRRYRRLEEKDQWLDRGYGHLPWSVRVEMDIGPRLLTWQLPLAAGQ